MPSSNSIIQLIEAGARIESIDATDRSSKSMVAIGEAIIARGGTPRFTNCKELSGNALNTVLAALNGDVIFDGV